MTKRMLIDGVHPEQTRVVVMDDRRLLEFDTEIASQRTLKGNIYLAKITRVEPSLQAAFVDYGGNRHGFLPFSEIHPDYYRIPVADREALKESQRRRSARDDDPEDDDDEDNGAHDDHDSAHDTDDDNVIEAFGAGHEAGDDDVRGDERAAASADGEGETSGNRRSQPLAASGEDASISLDPSAADGEDSDGNGNADGADRSRGRRGRRNGRTGNRRDGDDDRKRNGRGNRRSYTIQEVVKRGQIMLVQVVKEERGTKGAAVTTYLSLAGRYCVLMPNTARGGGISRKITNGKDRNRLKDIVDSLDIADSMAVIVRTAGIGRTKSEIKRDYEFLAKTWERIRDLTLQSRAPVLIYEESGLIKRTLRDTYTREIDEVIVQGDAAYREAKDFMKTLMPSHAKRVQPYKEASPPLLHRYHVDEQLHHLHSPIVQLPSGGYLVINLTEALVAIDVNSGRSTRERNIEETALKTNLEAAEEVARQLRLRDLAGLIVIDFIDMEDRRNNYAVERRLKDAMRIDRARVQIGRISQLGLLELSRQRLRPSLLETIMDVCPVCAGLGRVASTSSSAFQVLSAIEDEGMRGRSLLIKVHVAAAVAFYVLNEKRDELIRIERDYGLRCVFEPDGLLIPPNLRIEVLETGQPTIEAPSEHDVVEIEPEVEPEIEEEETVEAPRSRRRSRRSEESQDEGTDNQETGRRRGRRSGRRRDQTNVEDANADTNANVNAKGNGRQAEALSDDTDDSKNEERTRNRRSSRRRRRRGRGDGRSNLPGVALFARSATPLAWHVAAEDDNGQSAAASGKAAGGVPKPDAAQATNGAATEGAPVQPEDRPEGDAPIVSTPVAAWFEQTEAPGDAGEVAAEQPAVTPDAPEQERAPHDTVAIMMRPVAKAMEKSPSGRRQRVLQKPSDDQPDERAAEPGAEQVPGRAETEAPAESTDEPAHRQPATQVPEPIALDAGAHSGGDTASSAEDTADEEPAPQPEESKPAKPRRRGWWQRLLE